MDWNKDIDDTRIVNKIKVKIVYTNSRSLCNKIDEFEQTLAVEEVDNGAITETWFKPDHGLMIPGFEGFYSSRKKRRGGGVALFLDMRMLNKVKLITSNSNHGYDVVIVRLNLFTQVLYIAIFYRPPNLALDETIGSYKTPLVNVVNYISK